MSISRTRPKLKAMARRTKMPALRRFHDHAIAVTMVAVAGLTFAALIAISVLLASSSPYLGGLVVGVGVIVVAGAVWMSAQRQAPRRARRQSRTPGCRRRQMNRTWPVNTTPRPLPAIERRVRACRRQRHR